MRILKLAVGLSAVLTMAGALCAQDGPRGHWTGTIEVPDHAFAVQVDLDKPGDVWIGSITVPDQKMSGVPLEGIAGTGAKWTFKVKDFPGEPSFGGTLSADGKTLSGEFTHQDNTFPFKLTREGDPKVVLPKPVAALPETFLGTWEGALDAGGTTLRLVLKLSNSAGAGKGILTSLDQGNAEMPVNAIEATGNKLVLRVDVVGGHFEGEMNKEGTEVAGTWSQGPGSLPLTLKKAKS